MLEFLNVFKSHNCWLNPSYMNMSQNPDTLGTLKWLLDGYPLNIVTIDYDCIWLLIMEIIHQYVGFLKSS